MRASYTTALLGAALGLLLNAAVAAQRPVEAFASLPQFTDAQLSPDGTRYAAIQTAQGRPLLAIYTLGGAEPALVTSDDWTIRAIQWAKNDRIVAVLTNSQYIGYAPDRRLITVSRAIAVSPDGKGTSVLFKENWHAQANIGVASIADVALGDPDFVYLPLWAQAMGSLGGRYDLYRASVRGGESERVATGSENTYKWILDGNGGVVGRIDRSYNSHTDTLKVMQDGGWRDLATYEGGPDESAGVGGLSLDGTAIIRLGGRPRLALLSVDRASGRDTKLYEDPRYDVTDILRDPWTGRVTGAAVVRDRLDYVYLDADRQKLQRGLEKTFAGLTVTIASLDLTKKKAIVRVEGPRRPPAFYFIDRDTGEALEIGSSYPALGAGDLGEMKPYPYKARDGLDIPAYLTLPPGREPRGLPLVVMPHGGPDARDFITFDWWAQFLANRGYALLQPNFRGSAGYGRGFTEAGLQQWGLKMQDDISDGVMKAIADGIADPKRVCIVGASYGGYAALAGATLTPELYACAVSVAGISDLPTMMREQGGDFWRSRIGGRVDDSDRLRATSPARLAANVKAPILLLHGENDTTVPVKQSTMMRDALEKAGKPVRFVALAGDDHYLALGSTRLQMLREIEAFLATHIGR